METVKMYRPVGLKELELIMLSGWKKYPPRLEWQPIFYPVLNQVYASQIAREWNTNDPFSGNCGVVTSFNISKDHFSKYEVQVVGGAIHEELWVPAEKLKEFNDNIVGEIAMETAYFGDGFVLPEHVELAETLKKFITDARE